MDESHWIFDAKNRLTDAQSLFRYRSRIVEDEFGQMQYAWADQRGIHFARSYIVPQQKGIADGDGQFRRHLEAAETAHSAALRTEDQTRHCQAAQMEFENSAEEAARKTDLAHSFAERVFSETNGIRHDAASLEGRIAQLL